MILENRSTESKAKETSVKEETQQGMAIILLTIAFLTMILCEAQTTHGMRFPATLHYDPIAKLTLPMFVVFRRSVVGYSTSLWRVRMRMEN